MKRTEKVMLIVFLVISVICGKFLLDYWSHICELIKIDDDLERSFYERQTVNENWSVRELQRQIDSALFLRLAVSRDKEGILSLAQRGIEVQKPEDIIKSTYTLEFLNLPESSQYTESDLEQRLIDNLQKFLLELGIERHFLRSHSVLEV